MSGGATRDRGGGPSLEGAIQAAIRRVQDNLGEGVVVSEHGRVVYANEAAAAIVGYPLSELYAHPSPFDLVVPEQRELLRDRYERRLRGEAVPSHYDLSIIRRDGERAVVEIAIERVGVDGRQLHVSLFRDIGARKRAEAEVRESATQLRVLVEQMPATLWTTDADLRITSNFGAGYQRLGFGPNQFVGRFISDFASDPASPVLANHQRALAGEGVPFEFNNLGRDFQCYLEPLRNERGEIVGTIGTGLDITERKRAEAEQRRLLQQAEAAEARFRGFVELAPDGVVVVDHAGHIVLVNERIEEMFGFRREELIGRPVESLMPLRYHDLHANHLQEFEAAPARRPVGDGRELYARRRDGSEFPVEVGLSPVDADGERMHLSIVRDISARKRLEEQLAQAQKLEAVGRLAGGVAHDFNNMLGVILGHAELAGLRPDLDQPMQQTITEIRRAAERSAALTQQLLAFSRKQIVAPRVIDLNAAVHDIEAMLRRVIGEDVTLRTVLDPALGHVRADPGQIGQVVLNLAVNARDAMPDGGTLALTTANIDLVQPGYPLAGAARPDQIPADRYVTLTVADTGHGMDGATQQHVFEPFFTTKGIGQGTGLGLSTVYGIVRQSNGYVEVESAPGRGATFRVYLPRVEPEGEPEAGGAATSPLGRGSETVLVVEDEPAVRELTRRILELNGYVVLDAGSGYEALHLAEHHRGPIDLVIADVVMPGLGGRELVRRLRTRLPDLRVLYTSGYTDDEVVRRGIDSATTAFLQKPFKPRELAKRVRAVLDGDVS